ncbi:MAG: GDSL-type esterase/lipase family protein [Verrucomicrobiota bacterium]
MFASHQIRVATLFLTTLIALAPLCLAEQLSNQKKLRIVFIGDSITGQGGGWLNTGFVFQIKKALKKVSPQQATELIPLGGSGSGVHSWIGHEKRSRESEQEVFLDIKKYGLKENLGKSTDIMVIMLGMNDVLAPYVGDDKISLKKWQADYLSLITSLQARIHPKTTAIATISMATEDPASPKNQLIQRMNQLIREMAAQHHWLVLPVNTSVRKTLDHGRRINPRFHVTNDFVHPNLAGHIAVAIGMLQGLGENKAAAFLENETLQAVWQNEVKRAKKITSPTVSTPWLLASKLNQPYWKGYQFQPDKARTPIDDAIESHTDFTAAIDVGQGQLLQWKKYQPSINYTGQDQAGSADFSAITHAKIFEGGYGAQWIHIPQAAPVQIKLSSDIFAGNIHLTLWLNGKQLHQSLIKAKSPVTTIDATLQQGWNTLVFKANHRAWQWQIVVDVLSATGTRLADLEYSAEPHPTTRK